MREMQVRLRSEKPRIIALNLEIQRLKQQVEMYAPYIKLCENLKEIIDRLERSNKNLESDRQTLLRQNNQLTSELEQSEQGVKAVTNVLINSNTGFKQLQDKYQALKKNIDILLQERQKTSSQLSANNAEIAKLTNENQRLRELLGAKATAKGSAETQTDVSHFCMFGVHSRPVSPYSCVPGNSTPTFSRRSSFS